MALPQVATEISDRQSIMDLGRNLKARMLADRAQTLNALSGVEMPISEMDWALGVQSVEMLQRLGLAEVQGPAAKSLFAAKFVCGKLVFSDLPRADFRNCPLIVDPLWEGPTLVRMLVKSPARRAIDLGCGCGVFALVMSDYCDEVCAGDINPRALALTRLNAALSGASNVIVRPSDLFDGFEGSFDRVAFNAPVGEEFAARNLLEAGEDILVRFFTELPSRLAPDGVAQLNICANDRRGDTYFNRMTAWLGGDADEFRYVFLEQSRKDGGMRFLARRVLGSLKTRRNCLDYMAFYRGFLTLQRTPGESLAIATNYGTWLAQAHDLELGGALMALLERGEGAIGPERGVPPSTTNAAASNAQSAIRAGAQRYPGRSGSFEKPAISR